MAQNHLGLFDTPPDQREIRLGLVIVGLLVAALLAILPVHSIPLGGTAAFVPAINGVMMVCELIIGTLLYAQAAVFRSRALIALASGYVFAGLLLLPHALTFPGTFSGTGLLGAGVSTAAWLALVRRVSFPAAVILYGLIKRADFAEPEAVRPPARIFPGLACAIALAVLTTLLATKGHDLLPSLFVNLRDTNHLALVVVNSVTILLSIAAMAVFFGRKISVLDMWLLVALACWAIQSILNLPLQARFTLGWYCLFGMMMVSSLTVMLALIAESNRLYARLALSRAATDREREARLMTLDAMAAAMAHEVAQPLAAVTLNATAGLNWLGNGKPNIKLATESLRDTIDASHRAFDVIKNIRSTFSKGSDARTEFDLNALLRETTSLMSHELAVRNISLELALDDSPTTIFANRVQIQWVLVNLMTNAIEAVSASPRARSIVIRSQSLPSGQVLMEIKDSGAGVAPEKITQIFEPSFTSKSNGTGLGLSLSRTIVEEHGGIMWASPGEEQGATFHLQMPHSSSLEL